jgi:hypothetical protein
MASIPYRMCSSDTPYVKAIRKCRAIPIAEKLTQRVTKLVAIVNLVLNPSFQSLSEGGYRVLFSFGLEHIDDEARGGSIV